MSLSRVLSHNTERNSCSLNLRQKAHCAGILQKKVSAPMDVNVSLHTVCTNYAAMWMKTLIKLNPVTLLSRKHIAIMGLGVTLSMNMPTKLQLPPDNLRNLSISEISFIKERVGRTVNCSLFSEACKPY